MDIGRVDVRPEDRKKTASSVCTGLFPFDDLPFGSYNVPATCELLMENVYVDSLERNLWST